MIAAATSRAPIQRDTNSRHKLRILGKRSEAIDSEPLQTQLTDELPNMLPGISASESLTMIRFMVPLDRRATAPYICYPVLEVLTKCILKHPGPIETEAQRYRITRELRFRDCIAKGSTAARLSGESLEITSIKTASTDDEAWSEFIQIDTRSSLGLCEAPTCKNSTFLSGAI